MSTQHGARHAGGSGDRYGEREAERGVRHPLGVRHRLRLHLADRRPLRHLRARLLGDGSGCPVGVRRGDPRAAARGVGVRPARLTVALRRQHLPVVAPPVRRDLRLVLWPGRTSGRSIITVAAASYIAASFIPVVFGMDPFTTLEQLLVSFAIVLVATSINALGRAGDRGCRRGEHRGGGHRQHRRRGRRCSIFHREHSFAELFHTAGAGYGPGPFIWATVLAAHCVHRMVLRGLRERGYHRRGGQEPEPRHPQGDDPLAAWASARS